MLYSNDRKLMLSGWLQLNNASAYRTPLRLQKFLFLYEVFSKVSADSADFSRLKGYKRGPVFSPVWGDYTKDRTEFDRESVNRYNENHEAVNDIRAKRADFIVSSLTEDELSQLTHRYNIWSAKKNRIMDGEQQVELDEKDFNEQDYLLTHILEQMYPIEMVQNSDVISAGDKYFIFSKKDSAKLTEQHFDTLAVLAGQSELHNPVYAEIDEEGRLCVD